MSVGLLFSSLSYAFVCAAPVSAQTNGFVQAEFFVSPSGDDKNDGSYDDPFATVQAAQDAVRKINSDMKGDICVYISPGIYYVPETLTFNASDSGTNGYKIIYKALGAPDSVRLAGGFKVNSTWELVEASTNSAVADSDMQQSLIGKVYKTNLRAQLDETFEAENWPATSGPLPLNKSGKFTVNTITVNDERAVLARTLNSQEFRNMPSTLFENPLYTASGGSVDMTYNSSDASYLYTQQLVNAQDRGDLSAQIVCNDIGGRRAWNSDTLPIQNVDTGSRKLTFNPNDEGAFAPLYTIGSNSRYFLQGNLAFLDVPGEFYFNAESYDLYYYPKEGEENLSGQEIIIPTTDKVVSLEGERTGIWDDTIITPVENITFDGLKFSDTIFPDYYSSGYPWLPYASSTISKYGFPEWAKESTNPIYCGASERPQFQVGTVHLNYTDNITITNCHVINAGMNGIELYLGVTNTVISNSLVEFCGNGGIMIEGGFSGIDGNSQSESYTNSNTVMNTVVHDVGQMVHQSFGIQISNATYNTITNCEVYNSPRRGLLLIGNDVGGWNNTASGNRNWSPTAFDITRDQYAHGNTFSSIYMHNVQQDGGDDGGLFTVFVYYTSHGFSRPNYYDQIVIDEVGANPAMGDISPNNINLDMGWAGIEMSNIKTVNAQHYNVENSNLQNGQVKVDNCSFYFRNPQDGLDNFDDSKMDYDNIGVLESDYPVEYMHAVTSTELTRPDDIYFQDEFETPEIDWNKWAYSDSKPDITRIYMSEGAFNGKSALVIDNEAVSQKPVLYREFDNNLNKIVTVKIFDRQLSPRTTYDVGRRFPDTGQTTVRVDDGVNANRITLGIDPSFSNDYYIMDIGGIKTATSIRRVVGWHELKFDYSVPGIVTLSIDGTEVGTAARNNFNYVALGSADGSGENYYDQVYIYGGEEAPPIEDLPPAVYTAAPKADPTGGIINGETIVTLTCDTEGAEIYYTLDGSNPTVSETAQKYESPITISNTVLINAYSKKAKHVSSNVVTYGFAKEEDVKDISSRLEAEKSDDSYDVVNEGTNIGNFKPGGWMRYDFINFGDTLTYYKVKVCLALPTTSGNLEGHKIAFYLNDRSNPLGELTVQYTGNSWGSYATQEIVFEEPIKGLNSLLVEGVKGTGNIYVCNIDWYEFEVVSSVTVDKSELNVLTDAAKAIDQNLYTEATVQALQEALKVAQEVLKDENAQQADVDSARNNLQTAIDNLELKPTATISITGIETGNKQANLLFAILSANGKGYTVYLSATGEEGSFEKYDNVNYNAKGVHIKGLTNDTEYSAYIEYDDGSGSISKSSIVTFTPSK